jgi:hypothetical protein
LPSFNFVISLALKRLGQHLVGLLADPSDNRVPEIARTCLAVLGTQLRRLKEQILEFDRMIRAWHRSSEMSMRLDETPGVGPVLAGVDFIDENGGGPGVRLRKAKR